MSKVPWSMSRIWVYRTLYKGKWSSKIHLYIIQAQLVKTKIIYASGHDIVISTVLFIQHPKVLRHVSFNKLYAWECLLYKWFLLFKPNWIRTREHIFSGWCIRNLRSKLISWWFILFMESYAPSTFENSREDKRSHIAWTSRLYSYKTKTVQKKHKHNNISLS